MKRFLASIVLLVCLRCAAGVLDTPSKVRAQEVSSRSAIGQHLIVGLQGQVGVKRNGWSSYVPAMFGASLDRGDLLRLEGSSQAKVVCAGLTVYDAPSGISGVPCPLVPPVLKYRGSPINATRSIGSVSFPIVVSPRSTKLLNPRPRLRWTPVDGATRYIVVVRGSGLTLEAAVRSATELAYPDGAPSLRAGGSYKLIVSANDLQSDEEGGLGLGFLVVAPDEGKVVRSEEARIRNLGLPAALTDFLVGYLYASHGLSAEAIEMLEALSKSFEEPVVARLIGDLYQTVGLARQAELWYSTR